MKEVGFSQLVCCTHAWISVVRLGFASHSSQRYGFISVVLDGDIETLHCGQVNFICKYWKTSSYGYFLLYLYIECIETLHCTFALFCRLVQPHFYLNPCMESYGKRPLLFSLLCKR